VPNPKEIQAGFSATVIFKGKKGKAHLIKPSKLFLDNKGNLGVKGVDKDNRVVFYPIQIAAGDKNGAWVLGLPDELILIERGQGFVKEGIEVDVYYE
jgi:multidrug efflux system membrane fusion protein